MDAAYGGASVQAEPKRCGAALLVTICADGFGQATPSAGVRRYGKQVVAALGVPTRAARARLLEDVIGRLAGDGVADYEQAVERFGDPIQHAERVRVELGLPAAKPHRRFPRRLIAVVLLAGAAASAIAFATRDHDAASPLAVVLVGETSDDTAIDHGEVVVELHDGTDAEFAVVFSNTGDEAVELERVLPLSHVEVVGGHLVAGDDGTPIVQLQARLAPPGPAALRRAADFEDPLATPFAPTELAPGQQVSVLLQGTLLDCQLEIDDEVALPVRFSVEIDGEERIVDGPTVVFDATSCNA